MKNKTPLFIFSILFVLIMGKYMGAQNTLFQGQVAITRFAELSDTDYIVKVIDIRGPSQNGAVYGTNWNTPFIVPTGSAANSGWTPSRLGRVFGITIDADGNIYVAATFISVYPLISYTQTIFGSAGSGGIYKIENGTWAVTDFVTTLPAPSGSSATQIPNVGAGIGNLCYDQWNNQIFATNNEDGKIYRIDMNGNILSTYDPFGVDNATVGFTPLGERLWGIAAYGGDTGTTRIYFSRWQETLYQNDNDRNQIWSIALDANGDFIGSEQLEITVPRYDSTSFFTGSEPTAQINFSEDGRMLLAERSMSDDSISGAHTARTMIYTYNAGVWNGPLIFSHGNDIYTIPTYATNCSGGSDFAYEFVDSLGEPTGCDQLVWSIGDALQYPTPFLYGLIGMPAAGNTIANADATGYFIDEDNSTATVPKTYMGCLKVFRDCNDSIFTPPPPPPPPPVPEIPCEFLNAVTPNADGLNDFLTFSCVDSLGWRIVIYNRWGNKIYATDNYANNFPGGLLSDGVYYYVLESPDAARNQAGFFHVWNGQQ